MIGALIPGFEARLGGAAAPTRPEERCHYGLRHASPPRAEPAFERRNPDAKPAVSSGA
jgi:hypothetical protein